MRKIPYIEQILQGILLLTLISLLIFSVGIFYQIRISSQIVNYTGIIRGSSQRSVSLGLARRSSEESIRYVDRLYTSLQGNQTSMALSNSSYRSNLYKQRESWDEVKFEIRRLRNKHTRDNVNELLDTDENTISCATRRSPSCRIILRTCLIRCADWKYRL